MILGSVNSPMFNRKIQLDNGSKCDFLIAIGKLSSLQLIKSLSYQVCNLASPQTEIDFGAF